MAVFNKVKIFSRVVVDWLSLINPQKIRMASLLTLLIISIVFVPSCMSSKPAPTDDPQASVVKLRDELISFAKGNSNEITGRTEPEESFVLIYGYLTLPLDSLPISEPLQKKLQAISPPASTENYVLAHVYRDDIKEYTTWHSGGDNYHPLLSPSLFMIRGNPFKIVKKEVGNYHVDMKIE